jgi:hypothetical protein
MQMLDYDPESTGRTWLNPNRLDRLIVSSPYGAVAFVIVANELIATTGPIMEHLNLLHLAGLPYGEDKDSTDTDVFAQTFERSDIGLLRGNFGPNGLAIEFDLPKSWPLRTGPASGSVPDLETARLDLVLSYVREHPRVRAALPRSAPLRIHLRNYRREVNTEGWAYSGGEFLPFGDDC